MLAVPNRKDNMMTTDRSRAEQRLMNKAVHYLGRYSACLLYTSDAADE